MNETRETLNGDAAEAILAFGRQVVSEGEKIDWLTDFGGKRKDLSPVGLRFLKIVGKQARKVHVQMSPDEEQNVLLHALYKFRRPGTRAGVDRAANVTWRAASVGCCVKNVVRETIRDFYDLPRINSGRPFPGSVEAEGGYEAVGPEDTRLNPLLAAEAAEFHMLIVNVVGRLSERHKRVFHEVCVLGKTQEDVAEAIGWSESTVSRDLATIRAAVKEFVDEKRPDLRWCVEERKPNQKDESDSQQSTNDDE